MTDGCTIVAGRKWREDTVMMKEQGLTKRKADWLKQERRDFIDQYIEEWESEGWVEEGEAQEQTLRAEWREQHPDGSEEDWDKWLNRQLISWQAERREALREEAQGKWREQEAEYERRWAQYAKENAGENLRSEG
jgi:hypothetical protein